MKQEKSCANSLFNTIAEYFLLKTAVNHRKLRVFLTTQTTLYPIISKWGRALPNHLLLWSRGVSR